MLELWVGQCLKWRSGCSGQGVSRPAALGHTVALALVFQLLPGLHVAGCPTPGAVSGSPQPRPWHPRPWLCLWTELGAMRCVPAGGSHGPGTQCRRLPGCMLVQVAAARAAWELPVQQTPGVLLLECSSYADNIARNTELLAPTQAWMWLPRLGTGLSRAPASSQPPPWDQGSPGPLSAHASRMAGAWRAIAAGPPRPLQPAEARLARPAPQALRQTAGFTLCSELR